MRRDLLWRNTLRLSGLLSPSLGWGKGGRRNQKCTVLTLSLLSFLYAGCLPEASSLLALQVRAACDKCVNVCISQTSARKTFITRNWLLQLWELSRQVQNTQGRLPGQAGNSQSGAGTAFHRLNCFFLRETPVSLLRPFNWSDRAHPDYPGHSPLQKNHWL